MLGKSLTQRALLVLCLTVLFVGLLVCFSFAGDNTDNSPNTRLRYRTLGKSDIRITAVSMDCMHSTQEVISTASEMGINWFDTAWFYGRGRNEWAVGRALKDKRDKVFISTKIPMGTKDEMLKYLDMSLRRLQTDYVDMLMLHGVLRPEAVLNTDALAALQEAKASGKARLIGVSINGRFAACLDAAVQTGIYDAVQTVYAPGMPEEVKAAVLRARKSGLMVIAMLVHPSRIDDLDGEFAADEAAIKGVLDDPNISFIVAETLSVEQLKSNVAAMQSRVPATRDVTILEAP